MKIALLSDIHANATALEAVLSDSSARGVDGGMWVSGDSVGYGPDPNECMEMVRADASLVVAGNHELAVVGKMPVEEFNQYAAAAARWTGSVLSDENRDYILALPLRLEDGDCTIVHGSPRDPVWEYLLSSDAARENLEYFDTTGCVIGHSHFPLYARVTSDGGELLIAGGGVMRIREERFFINPGSVGQPRDGDPRAAYAIYDPGERTVSYRRVEYDIQATQARMESAGLPVPLIQRLSRGR